MDATKFLEETKALKNKLCQYAGNESGRISFLILAKQLQDEGKIDKQIMDDLKKIWELRNQICCSLAKPYANISIETQTLLASLISNPKLQSYVRM